MGGIAKEYRHNSGSACSGCRFRFAPDGTILSADDSFAGRWLGGARQCPNVWNSSLFTPKSACRLEKTCRRLTAANPIATTDLALPRPDGQVCWLRVELTADFGHSGEVTVFQACAHDITDLKLKEKKLEKALRRAERLHKLQSAFLADMSHEIRTPMNAVVGFTSLLNQTELDDEQRLCVDSLLAGNEQLLRIVNDVLDFSKIEAGRLEIVNGPFDLRELADEMEALFRPKAEDIEVAFKTRLHSGLPQQVVGDRMRIKQVLCNLLSNAFKFTRRGEIVLRVNTVERADAGIGLEFSVSDTGIGISADCLNTVFEPYTQADDSIRRSYGGTGLGLAISKRIVQAMGGDLSVNSRQGAGSIFRFAITLPPEKSKPLVAVPRRRRTRSPFDETDKKPLELSPSDKECRARLKILLVDDNVMNQRVIGMMLSRLGYTFDLAGSGDQVLKMVSRCDYDAILMDVVMPGMDGIETARRIIQSRPPAQRPGIIAMTARAFKEDKGRCLEAGMDDYVAKPLCINRLDTVLRRYLPHAPPLRNRETAENGKTGLEHYSAIDTKILNQLGSGDEDSDGFLEEIVTIFLRDTPDMIERIHKGLEHGDREKLAISAHTLKGNCRMIGAVKLSALCHNLDRNLKTHPADELIPMVEAISREYDRVCRELQALKLKLSAANTVRTGTC